MSAASTGKLERQQRQLVVFTLAGESYGVDIHRVREIIRVPEITRVPKTPDFIEGVINLRGGVLPVLDLRKRFGLPPTEGDAQRRIVVVELDAYALGMIVDGVSQVLRIDADAIEPPSPYIVSVDTQYIAGVIQLEERLVILLDLDRVLQAGEQRTLAAFNAENGENAAD